MPIWTAITLILAASAIAFVVGAMMGSSKRESEEIDERAERPIWPIEESNVFFLRRGDRP